MKNARGRGAAAPTKPKFSATDPRSAVNATPVKNTKPSKITPGSGVRYADGGKITEHKMPLRSLRKLDPPVTEQRIPLRSLRKLEKPSPDLQDKIDRHKAATTASEVGLSPKSRGTLSGALVGDEHTPKRLGAVARQLDMPVKRMANGGPVKGRAGIPGYMKKKGKC